MDYGRGAGETQPTMGLDCHPHLTGVDKAATAVMAGERVTFLGLPMIINRKVNYHAIDPALCRSLFIRYALVEVD